MSRIEIVTLVGRLPESELKINRAGEWTVENR